MKRRHIELDGDILGALTLLAADTGTSLQTLAEQAIADLLKKHGRPEPNLRDALRQSLRSFPVNDNRTAAPKEQAR